MSVLSRVESMFEAVFEGSFRRLFSSRLQPIEVARALERIMFNQKVVGTSSPEVPNIFLARLHPQDFERFASFKGSVEKEAAAYLDRRAAEEGCRPIGRIRVELVEDASVSKSVVRGEARFSDEGEVGVPPTEHTRRFSPVSTPAAAPGRTLRIHAEDGQEITVDSQSIRIGRGIDNDLVLRDVRVSRHHASIDPSPHGWIVRDLQSTNGTFVNGRRVEEGELDPEAELSLGGYRLTLQGS
jgi:hypothetical protein